MKLIIKISNIICIIISIIFLLYVFYRSEFYYHGTLRGYYFKYYFILSLSIIFFILIYFINDQIKNYIFISIGSIIFSLYLFEFYILFSNGINLFTDHNKFVYKSARTFLKDRNIYLLNNTPNKNYLSTRENGYFAHWFSDRYGFNNPDEEWDKQDIDIVLVGDSFTQGEGVNRPYDIASQLRNSKQTVLSLGLSGHGPLKNYAMLKEYLKSNHKKIFYLHYEGNDLTELNNELNDPHLVKYLNNDFKYNLSTNNFYLRTPSLFEGFIKIFYTRRLMEKYYFILFVEKHDKKKNKLIKISDFEKILKLCKEIVITNNSQFYFVYLPSKSRYVNIYSNKNFEDHFDQVKKIIEDLNIPFIDVQEIFNENKNINSLFAKYGGHYSIEGYKEVAKVIKQFVP